MFRCFGPLHAFILNIFNMKQSTLSFGQAVGKFASVRCYVRFWLCCPIRKKNNKILSSHFAVQVVQQLLYSAQVIIPFMITVLYALK